MESINKLSWGLLALLHLPPSAALFSSAVRERLYGSLAQGDVGLMLQHRAALFLCLALVGAYAVIAPGVRQLATILFAVSMISFLLLYLQAGMPGGPLRTIAIADLIGLVPLAVVAIAAFGTKVAEQR